MNFNQATVYVSDLNRSIFFYAGLGLKLIVRNEHYARFIFPEGSATLSLHASSDVNANKTCLYFECERFDDVVQVLKEKGYHFDTEILDQTWLWREAHLRDPDGQRLCLFYAGENRRDPPWKIQT